MSVIDYSNYTLDELYDVLDNIDKDFYAENYKCIIAEIDERKLLVNSSGEKQSKHDKANVKPEERKAINDYWDPKSANKSQSLLLKNLGLIKVGIVLGVLCLPAYFNTYLIEESYYKLIKDISWICSLLMFFGMVEYYTKFFSMCAAKLFPASNVNKSTNTQFTDNSKFISLVCALLFSFGSFFIFFKTLPVVVHIYFLDDIEVKKQVVVLKKRHRFRKKHCNGKIYLEEYEHAFFSYLCNVFSRKSWEDIRKGDHLEIIGTQSEIGFLVKGAKKLPE